MLTLRQIEVIRAIMIAGTVKGAADLLNVSPPGISRVMKHAEAQLGLRLFQRTHGRYTPTAEAEEIFDQISEVFRCVGNLHHALDALKSGDTRPVAFASVPSIASYVFPAAVQRLRGRFPALKLQLNTLKIEEAIDYLLLNKGELVALSYKLDHPNLSMLPLYSGKLVAILPSAHDLAKQSSVSLNDLVREKLIGIDPKDPYGGTLAAPFADAGLPFELSIEARTGHMISMLVAQGLGVSIIDELSVAGPERYPGLAVRPIDEPTSFKAFAAFNAQRPRSNFADALVGYLKTEMRLAASNVRQPDSLKRRKN